MTAVRNAPFWKGQGTAQPAASQPLCTETRAGTQILTFQFCKGCQLASPGAGRDGEGESGISAGAAVGTILAPATAGPANAAVGAWDVGHWTAKAWLQAAAKQLTRGWGRLSTDTPDQACLVISARREPFRSL